MADTSIGKAYVQIVPTAKGISKDIEGLLDGDVKKNGKNAGITFGSEMVGAIKKAAAVIGIGKIFSDAINAGGDLQQSFGGLETIYGDAADAAKDYAYQAAQAGISANDYAEQAVSFGASLKQAFEGDTTKAVEAANTAIMDMTDNAAKMGTPIENIQNAYQGFAKQNYTMLDNLKLGYGGTKEEMERLLADASKLSGVEYNIDNLGDVYDAIHVIQEDLGLTGVAAQEASETFSGSFGAMQASAQNLLADIALGADIGPDIEALGQSVSTFFTGNLLPMISNIVQQIPGFVAQIPGFITDMIPEVIPAIADMVAGFAQGLIDNAPAFVDGMHQLMESAREAIFNIDWMGAADLVVQLLKTGWSMLENAAQETWDLVVGIFTGEIEFPDLSGAARTVWNGLTTVAAEVWAAVKAWFTKTFTWPNISEAARTVWSALSTVAQSIWTSVKNWFTKTFTWPDISEAARNVWNALTSVAASIWNAVKTWFQKTFTFPSLVEAAKTAWNALTTTASEIWNAIKTWFTKTFQFPSLDDLASAAWNTLTGIASGIWDEIKKVFGALDISFADLSSAASEAWNGLTTAAGTVWQTVKDTFSKFDIQWPNFAELAGDALQALEDAATGVWNWIKDLFSGDSDDEAVKQVQGSTDEMVAALADAELKISEVDVSSIQTANEFVKNTALGWKRIFDNIKLTLPPVTTKSLATAATAIGTATSTYKDKMRFSWSLPTLHGHLPVISVNMRTASSSDGKTTVSYPDLSVSGFKWFAKGGIFDAPSVIGVGEAGTEAVVPLDRLWKQMDKTLEKHSGGVDVYQTFNVTTNDPVQFTNEVARELQQQLRMG